MKERDLKSAILTVLTLCMSLLMIHFISGWQWPVIASLILGLTGVIFPKLAFIIERFWKFITKFIGMLIQRVILVIVFLFLLFPIAIAARLFRKHDAMNLSHTLSSTFVDVNKKFDAHDFEKPW